MVNNNINISAGGIVVILLVVLIGAGIYFTVCGGCPSKNIDGDYQVILQFTTPVTDSLSMEKRKMIYKIKLAQNKCTLFGSGIKLKESWNDGKKSKTMRDSVIYQADIIGDSISSTLRFKNTPDRKVIRIGFNSPTPHGNFIDASFFDIDSGRRGTAIFTRETNEN